ncbi:hypothetical protein F8S13_15055 [Chloroflexia bacterium SDU3-3]|nr:hypothetical protein F8S13_15055 [Chloroflexia bacterium SDU3-3]
MQSRAAGMQSRAAGMQSQAAGLHSRAAGLHSQAAGLQSQAAGMQSQAAGLHSRAAGLQSRAAGMRGLFLCHHHPSHRAMTYQQAMNTYISEPHRSIMCFLPMNTLPHVISNRHNNITNEINIYRRIIPL